ILMSGWMDVDLAVEAMKMGALRAVALPFDIWHVVQNAFAETSAAPAGGAWPVRPFAPRLPHPRSSAERLAHLMLGGCDADHDRRTLTDWAAAVGASRSALVAACRMVNVRPHDARDFVRVLRVLCHHAGGIDHLRFELLVADHGTLSSLLRHAGLAG